MAAAPPCTARVFALAGADSLACCPAVLADACACPPDLFVFDFDQTITRNTPTPSGAREFGVRGDEAAVAFLRGLTAERFICTAAPPTLSSIDAIVLALRRLGLADVFDVAEPDIGAGLRLAAALGTDDESLDFDVLELKLMLLLVLRTPRTAADLARIGLANCALGGGCARYRLHQGGDDWSAAQQLAAADVLPTWQSYLGRAAERHARLGGADRLFACVEPASGTLVAYDGAAVRARLAAALAPCGMSPCDVLATLDAPRRVVTTPSGVAVACAGRVLASSYNKADAIEFLLATRGASARHLVFVDDSSDNIMKVLWRFEGRSLADLALQRCTCIWLQPPATGAEERYDAAVRAELLARLAHDSAPATAHTS